MARKLYTEAIKREGIKLDKSALEKKDKQHLYICNKSRKFQVPNLHQSTCSPITRRNL